MSRQEVGRTAAHGLAVVRRSADQQACLDAAENLWRFRIRDIHAPDRKRFGHVRLAQTGDLSPLDFNSPAGLLARITEGWEGESAVVEAGVLGRRDGTVFEQADVCDVDLVSADRQ